MFSKVARMLTVVPVIALVTLILLYRCAPTSFSSVPEGCLIGFLLCVFPLLAYPLQPVFPKFKQDGRQGQRKLAFVFAVVGYTLALLCALTLRFGLALLRFVLVYFFSALLLVLLNFGFHIRASAHASGVTCSALILFDALGVSPALTLFAVTTMALVWYASLSMRRHQGHELLLGSLLPLLAFRCA